MAWPNLTDWNNVHLGFDLVIIFGIGAIGTCGLRSFLVLLRRKELKDVR
jgi:hypothetical protein